jgi:hypothetical protein
LESPPDNKLTEIFASSQIDIYVILAGDVIVSQHVARERQDAAKDGELFSWRGCLLIAGLNSCRCMFTCGGAEKPNFTVFRLMESTFTSISGLMQTVSPFFRVNTNILNLLPFFGVKNFLIAGCA